MLDTVIWDFNGTILDDMGICLEATDTLLAERGLPPIGSVERYREIFGFPIKDYYVRAGFDFSVEPYETVANAWMALYLSECSQCKLYDGVREAIEHIRDTGIAQIVLSASESKMLAEQLRFLGVADLFDEILGCDDIYAHGKTELGVRWRQRHPNARALFVGDTEHDAETAKAMGAECVLIASGHQPTKTLLACGVPVLPSVRDFPAYFDGIRNEF